MPVAGGEHRDILAVARAQPGIEVDVNESFIARVQAGQPVEAVLDAYPDWTIPARVITTIPAADRQKATVLVRIGFLELDPRILPDMGIKVAFLDEGEEPGQAANRLGQLSAGLASAHHVHVQVVEDGREHLQ